MVKNDNALKILSLLIAIFLWLYVIGEVNPTVTQTIENIPVSLLNENTLEQRDLAIDGDVENLTVDIVVEGTRGDLNRLDRDEIKATADIFGYEKGLNHVPVQVDVPENLKLTKIKTPKLEILLEDLVSVYKEIRVNFTGKMKSGTEAGDVSVSPAEIEVKGAQNAVNSVESVQVEVNASEVTDEHRTFTAEPSAISKEGNPVYGVSLSAENIEIETVLYHTKTVTLTVDVKGRVPERYELEDISVPDEITIKGTKKALTQISSVEAESVDLSKVTASTSLAVKPKLPEGVEVSEESQNDKVEIKIRGLSTGRLKLSTADCVFNHLDENLKAHVNTAQLLVAFIGQKQLVEHADQKDFVLSVDLRGLGEGKHLVSPKVTPVTKNMKFRKITVKPRKVEVTITKES